MRASLSLRPIGCPEYERGVELVAEYVSYEMIQYVRIDGRRAVHVDDDGASVCDRREQRDVCIIASFDVEQGMCASVWANWQHDEESVAYEIGYLVRV